MATFETLFGTNPYKLEWWEENEFNEEEESMNGYTKRAIAYLEKAFGRKVIANPEKHEPGFYHMVFPTIGKPYFSKIAYLSDPKYTGGIPAIVDVTGDSDQILKYLN